MYEVHGTCPQDLNIDPLKELKMGISERAARHLVATAVEMSGRAHNQDGVDSNSTQSWFPDRGYRVIAREFGHVYVVYKRDNTRFYLLVWDEVEFLHNYDRIHRYNGRHPSQWIPYPQRTEQDVLHDIRDSR